MRGADQEATSTYGSSPSQNAFAFNARDYPDVRALLIHNGVGQKSQGVLVPYVSSGNIKVEYVAH